MNRRLTFTAKLVIALFVVGVLFGAYKFADSKGWVKSAAVAQTAKSPSALSGLFSSNKHDSDTIRVGVVTWGGYAGGQYFNGGFKSSEASRYLKDYGLKVEFIVNDEYVSSREAWKAGEIDVLWTTVDSFPIESSTLSEFEPKVIFQSDWSRGGDAIVARRGLDSINSLRGMKIAAAYGTPSHTFLLWMLEAADLKPNDITLVQTDSAVAAAAMFKSGKVDAAVVWSPDDEDCVASVQGSRILKSTKQASNIISDVFYVKSDYLQKNREKLKSLVEGWLIGAAEINSSPAAKSKAVKILAEGLNIPADVASKAIDNTRLTTVGDNQAFFGLVQNGSMTGEQIYNKMSDLYKQVGVITSKVPNWRSVTDANLVSSLQLSGAIHAAEVGPKFTAPTKTLETAQAFTTKHVTVTFPSGSSLLNENAKYAITTQFGEVAKAFSHSRVRIEGNTDNVGSPELNRVLSLQRAQAVADFLAREYRFDRNRFVVVGNGPNKPVSDNATDAGRATNRRTDFELISE
jgi:NitT/TauT family transport system substrate-binding protein